MTVDRKLNVVPFVSVDHMMKLVLKVGIDTFLTELAAAIEEDFRRWPIFDKTPRVGSHSNEGVIELMPTSDGALYGFKYVNGHPKTRGTAARRSPLSVSLPMSETAIRCFFRR
nr:hypothetical protein K4M20_00029 [Agrobacterium fabrum]